MLFKLFQFYFSDISISSAPPILTGHERLFCYEWNDLYLFLDGLKFISLITSLVLNSYAESLAFINTRTTQTQIYSESMSKWASSHGSVRILMLVSTWLEDCKSQKNVTFYHSRGAIGSIFNTLHNHCVVHGIMTLYYDQRCQTWRFTSFWRFFLS